VSLKKNPLFYGQNLGAFFFHAFRMFFHIIKNYFVVRTYFEKFVDLGNHGSCEYFM